MNTNRLKRNYNGLIKMAGHNHPGGSLFDAVDEPKNYCESAVKAGYSKFAVTDHGSFSAMQHCIDYVNKAKLDLQIIYGVEAYVEIPGVDINDNVSHVIFMAVDEDGKHIIDKLNSYAGALRKGTPVITWEQFSSTKFNGHVIATSACVAGAPAYWLLVNNKIQRKVNSWIAKLSKCDDSQEREALDPNSEEAKSAISIIDNINNRIEELISLRDSKTYEAEIKAANLAARDYKAKNMIDEMEKEKAKALEATEKLNNIKKELASSKKKRTELKKEYSNIFNKVERWEYIQSKIEELKKSFLSQEEKEQKASEMIELYNSILGQNNYFIELQYHGLEMEREAYPILARMAKEKGIPVIAANDAHMADNSQRSINMRNVARFLRYNKVSEESEEDKELYIKTPNELATALLEIFDEDTVDEAMMNLNIIADRCNYIPTKVLHYPKYDKHVMDSNILLREEVLKGINWRYPNGIGWDEEHQKRVEYELDVIISMGFADYLLIVKDFLEYARIIGKIPVEELDFVPLTKEGAKEYAEKHNYEIGIGVGAGRGSGAGSIVNYVLGITDIDPFKYGLIFERFLNPERVSMPDIDSDLAIGVREKTIDYVRNRYGNNAVVGILTESREGAKGAIKDCARYWSCKLSNNEDSKRFLKLGDSIAKLIPETVGTSFSSIIYEEKTVKEYLLEQFSNDSDAIAIINLAIDCEGMLRGYGQHAAGVIIYDNDDITDYIPTRYGKKGPQTEMDMIQCEANGLLKMDFLGLRNLSIITDTLRMIYEQEGIKIDINNVDPSGEDSQPVYENVFKKGRTKNVFQFESAGMRNYLKQLFAD